MIGMGITLKKPKQKEKWIKILFSKNEKWKMKQIHRQLCKVNVEFIYSKQFFLSDQLYYIN